MEWFLKSKDIKSISIDYYFNATPSILKPLLKSLKKSPIVWSSDTLDKHLKRYHENVVIILFFCHKYIQYDTTTLYNYLKSIITNQYTAPNKKQVCNAFCFWHELDLLTEPLLEQLAIKKAILLNTPSQYPFAQPNFTISKDLASLAHIALFQKEAYQFLLDGLSQHTGSTLYLYKMVFLRTTFTQWDPLLAYLQHTNLSPTIRLFVLRGLIKQAPLSALPILASLLPCDPIQQLHLLDQHKDLYAPLSKSRQALVSLQDQFPSPLQHYVLFLDHLFEVDLNKKTSSLLISHIQSLLKQHASWSSTTISTEEWAIYHHKDHYPHVDVLQLSKIKDPSDRQLRLKQLNNGTAKLSKEESTLVNAQIEKESLIRQQVQEWLSHPIQQQMIQLVHYAKSFQTVAIIELPHIRSILDAILYQYRHLEVDMDTMSLLFQLCHLHSHTTMHMLLTKWDHAELFLHVTSTQAYPVIAHVIQTLLNEGVLIKPVCKYLAEDANCCKYLVHHDKVVLDMVTKWDSQTCLLVFPYLDHSTVFDALMTLYNSHDHQQRMLVYQLALLMTWEHPCLQGFFNMAHYDLETDKVTSKSPICDYFKESEHQCIWHAVASYQVEHQLVTLDTLIETFGQLPKVTRQTSTSHCVKSYQFYRIYIYLKHHLDEVESTLSQFLDRKWLLQEEQVTEQLIEKCFKELMPSSQTLLRKLLDHLERASGDLSLCLCSLIGCFKQQVTVDIYEQLAHKLSQTDKEADQIRIAQVMVHFISGEKQVTLPVSGNEQQLRSMALIHAAYAKYKGFQDYPNLGHLESMIEGMSHKDWMTRYFVIKWLDYTSLFFGRLYEPYLMRQLLFIANFGDGHTAVREATEQFSSRIMPQLSVVALKMMVPKVLLLLQSDQWRTRHGCCRILGYTAAYASLISNQLHHIIPVLSGLTSDSHYQVKQSANEALDAFANAISNPELKSHTKSIIQAIVTDELEEVLIALLSTKFQHIVDASSFSLLLPLLQKSLVPSHKKDILIRGAQLIGALVSLCHMDTILQYFTPLLTPLQHLVQSPLPQVRSYAAKAYGTICEQLPNKADILEDLLNGLGTSDMHGHAQLVSEVFAANGTPSLQQHLPLLQSDKEAHLTLFMYLPLAYGSAFEPFLKDAFHCLIDGIEHHLETCIKACKVLIEKFSHSSIQLLIPCLLESLKKTPIIRWHTLELLQDLIVELTGLSFTSKADQSFVYESLKETFEHQFCPILSLLFVCRFDSLLDIRSMCQSIWKLIVVNTHDTLEMIHKDLLLLLLTVQDSDHVLQVIQEADFKYKQFHQNGIHFCIEHHALSLLSLFLQVHKDMDILHVVLESIDDETQWPVIASILQELGPQCTPHLVSLDIDALHYLCLHVDYLYGALLPQMPSDLFLTINESHIVNRHYQAMYTKAMALESAQMFEWVDETPAYSLLSMCLDDLNHKMPLDLVVLLSKQHPTLVYERLYGILMQLPVDHPECFKCFNACLMTIPKKETHQYCHHVLDMLKKKELLITNDLAFVPHVLLSNYTSSQQMVCVEAVWLLSQQVDMTPVFVSWIGPLIRILHDAGAMGAQLMMYYLSLDHPKLKPFLPQIHRAIVKSLNGATDAHYKMVHQFMRRYTRLDVFLKDIAHLDGFERCFDGYPLQVNEEWVDKLTMMGGKAMLSVCRLAKVVPSEDRLGALVALRLGEKVACDDAYLNALMERDLEGMVKAIMEMDSPPVALVWGLYHVEGPIDKVYPLLKHTQMSVRLHMEDLIAHKVDPKGEWTQAQYEARGGVLQDMGRVLCRKKRRRVPSWDAFLAMLE